MLENLQYKQLILLYINKKIDYRNKIKLIDIASYNVFSITFLHVNIYLYYTYILKQM